MFERRLRSHHDAEEALRAALSGNKRPSFGGRPGNLPPKTGGKILTALMRRMVRMKMKKTDRELVKKLMSSPSPSRRCVYIHVPYCDRLCTFCSLVRSLKTDSDFESYTAQLEKELNVYGSYPYIREKPFNAVYFGGGTPTALDSNRLERIMRALRKNIPLSPSCEITMESTLHNLDTDKLRCLEDAGVNRFSIGIQTFSERGRRLLGRVTPAAKAEEKLAFLRGVFSGVLCIDIIYNYPGQTDRELFFDAQRCVDLNPDSVSFYSLMIQNGSSLEAAIRKGGISFQENTERDRRLHNRFYQTLIDSGFSLLELSKLALPGRDEYRYIKIRYENGDVIPVGSGAGGSIGGFSVYQMPGGLRMVSRPDPDYERYNLLLGCFQAGGYSLPLITKMGQLNAAQTGAVRERLLHLENEGFLKKEAEETWTLTTDGIFWGNNIAVQVLETAVSGGRK
ncbi:MAG: radical SAM protein [Treponema sp.]|jgi:oxygen-independent coproporphyrinogen-3 oxidase|nr:radical SAM protein [Treponema sp.]